MMSDGRALQAGTSHNLGQHFAKVFEIKYLDEDQTEKFVWQTSWGVSTRLVGAVIMSHGDDFGLRLPPRIAPVQAIIVPIFFDKGKDELRDKCEEISNKIKAAGIRVETDLREVYTPGWKYNFWEMKGVPVRIEIGPRDMKKSQVVMIRRDSREKFFVPEGDVVEKLTAILEEYQKDTLARAREFQKENIRHTDNYEELKTIIEEKRGFVVSPWCGDEECETKVKEDTKATIRCIPFGDERDPQGKNCICCNKPAQYRVYFARAY
jgi:prolyl-tRNA synthetase